MIAAAPSLKQVIMKRRDPRGRPIYALQHRGRTLAKSIDRDALAVFRKEFERYTISAQAAKALSLGIAPHGFVMTEFSVSERGDDLAVSLEYRNAAGSRYFGGYLVDLEGRSRLTASTSNF